jgi:hypothetical protein
VRNPFVGKPTSFWLYERSSEWALSIRGPFETSREAITASIPARQLNPKAEIEVRYGQHNRVLDLYCILRGYAGEIGDP